MLFESEAAPQAERRGITQSLGAVFGRRRVRISAFIYRWYCDYYSLLYALIFYGSEHLRSTGLCIRRHDYTPV